MKKFEAQIQNFGESASKGRYGDKNEKTELSLASTLSEELHQEFWKPFFLASACKNIYATI